MLDFIVAPPGITGPSGKYPVLTAIPDEACYAFFSRYFADAQLDRARSNFLGFWGATEISGYQLVRLRQVLQDSLLDLSSRPERFRTLQGWTSFAITLETERWGEVSRDQLAEIARELIDAINQAEKSGNNLLAIGD